MGCFRVEGRVFKNNGVYCSFWKNIGLEINFIIFGDLDSEFFFVRVRCYLFKGGGGVVEFRKVNIRFTVSV